MSWVGDVGQLAGAVASAVAAIAAWRAVSASRDAAQQARDAAEEALRPELHAVALAVRTGPDNHPFPYDGAVRLNLRVENGGSGLAKRAGFVFACAHRMAAGSIDDGFLRPGEGRLIETTISTGSKQANDFAWVVFCWDRREVARYWTHDNRTGVIEPKHLDGNVSIRSDLWDRLYPGIPWDPVLSQYESKHWPDR